MICMIDLMEAADKDKAEQQFNTLAYTFMNLQDIGCKIKTINTVKHQAIKDALIKILNKELNL